MKEKSSEKSGAYKRVILTTLITVVVSFLAYMLFYNVIIIVLYMDVRAEDRDWSDLTYAVMIIFAIVFYFVYARRHIDSSGIGITGGSFDIKEAVTDFYHADGKTFMIVYGVLAVLYEVSCLIAALSGKVNILILVFSFLFPAADLIKVPVLRTAVAYAVAIMSVFAVVVYRKYKLHKYWAKGI